MYHTHVQICTYIQTYMLHIQEYFQKFIEIELLFKFAEEVGKPMYTSFIISILLALFEDLSFTQFI